MSWDIDLQALWLTLKLAMLTVVILLMVCLPAAWLLNKYQGRFKPVIEALITLPLVLPPTVLGFYLLMAFSPNAWLGNAWLQVTGEQLTFSFTGILLGSLIYSLPFVMQPLMSGLSQLGEAFEQQAASLGIVTWKRFAYLLLPLLKPSIISAATLGFAHTLGEFGLVLMIGGNIPGETQVLSIALYNHVELLEYQQAHNLAALLLLCSFLSLLLLYKFNRPLADIR
ncbi:MAG: molybdate ABC transporter permease subunit [Gammaproteobacteria bacterium]|nr:molybdate ABC transporter permease subunit [Gammaproteobacteria bacterium]